MHQLFYFNRFEKKPIPYIVIQEQNSYPGLTNKFFAKNADLIFTAFTETANHLGRDVINSGNPIRFGINEGDRRKSRKFFQFNKNIKVLFYLVAVKVHHF